MIRDRGKDRKVTLLTMIVGTASGLAAGVLLWRARRRDSGWTPVRARRIEEQYRELLRADSNLHTRSIDAGMLADGILELSGTVRDGGEAERAVALGQRIPGVRTVLNRLDVEILEDHLAETRTRYDDGDPRLRESHWYGIGVGMGRRRQSAATDPDRPSDKASIKSRELGANRAVEQASEPLDKIPSGVEGHTSVPAGPTDRGTIADSSHRRIGNVSEQSTQDLNTAARVHQNIKIGTRLTLEKSGLEEKLQDRGREDRS